MNLETTEGGQPPQATKDNKEKSKVPVGVTLIGDDEDEVQLGVQKAMRLPRQALPHMQLKIISSLA